MIEQHQSLAEKFLKKWFWLYVFSFIISPIWYIIKIVLSHDLSVSDIGIIYWVMSLVVLFSMLNDFWMTESLNKFIPQYITLKDYKKVKQVFFYAIFTQIITWIIIFLFFYFLSDFIAVNYLKEEKAWDIIKIFAFFFLWINFFQVINTFFMAVQNTFLQKLTEFIRMFFILLITLYIFFTDIWNIFNYSLSRILWLYIWIVFSVIIFYQKYYKNNLKKEIFSFDKKLFIKMFKYSFFVFLRSQVRILLSQIDMQMVIYLLWTKDAWYYTNYLSIISIPIVIIWPIFAFVFPVFSEMVAKKEFDKIKLVKNIFQKNFFVFWLYFNALLFIFAEIITIILFGEKFITSWKILVYSILFLVFDFLLQINFSILASLWRIKIRFYIVLIGLGFNTILNFILIKTIWVYWARLATWLWWVLMWVLSEYMLKDFRVKFDLLYIFKNIIFLLIIWTFIYIFIVPTFNWINRINSLFYLSFVSIIYFSIFFILNFKEFKYFINEIKKLKKS